MSAQLITREIHDNTVYLATTYRGTIYTLRRSPWAWEVSTRRLALGRGNIGGVKHFDTLADVRANCKAFAGVELLDSI